jgi:hypothetical protein
MKKIELGLLAAALLCASNARAEETTGTATLAVEAPAEAQAAVEAPAEAEASDGSEAELLASLMNESSLASSEEGPSLRFYGFADFGLSKYLIPESSAWKQVLNGTTNFAVGNLNLYLDADLTNDFKSLIEVRFLFLPSGTDDPNKPGVLDPSVDSRYAAAKDYADLDRLVKWGAIEVERAYVEYTLHSLLRARAGRFLTPWGIWNVDHGSPVIIATMRPYIIGEGFFPEAQTGFEFFGNYGFGDATAGYHVTLSNGRGPVEQYADFDTNKALGARLWLNMKYVGDLTFGASAYAGTYSDQRSQIDLTQAAPLPQPFMFESYREQAFAADVRFELGDLLLQSEIALHERVWDDDKRPIDRAGNAQPDNRRLGIYGLVAYRLPWFNLRPFAVVEYYDTGTAILLGGSPSLAAFSAGLNVRITPNVVAKASFAHVMFLRDRANSLASEDFTTLMTQLSWAF